MENYDESFHGYLKFCWENRFLFVAVTVLAVITGILAANLFGAEHRIPEQLPPLPETISTSFKEAE